MSKRQTAVASYTNFAATTEIGSNYSRPLKTLLLSCCLLLTLAACGGGGGGSPAPNFGGKVEVPVVPVIEPSVWRIGNGSGASFVAGVINSSLSTLNSGEIATLRVNVVNQRLETPGADTVLTVNFTSTCAANGLAIFGVKSEISPGLHSITYTNNGCDGEDTIFATIAQNKASASVKMKVIGPEVLSVSFVSSTSEQLSLAGIGGTESAELTFKVSGPQAVPIIGKLVSFAINTQVGGAAILKGRETGITDQTGIVRTVINSGTVAGPVNVLATHNASGRQGLSKDIIISTGVPEASRFSMSYNNHNPAGAFNIDGTTVAITIIASDTFGNNPTDGTKVSFVAPEGGNVQNSCVLIDGACSVTWRSTSPRPADMRVEVIAYTDGAEDYVDNNGNSVFDIKDGAIIDLTEPFADENESGAYNVGEYFFDTNKNGIRDIGNGLWDGPCLSKVDPTAICTGKSTVAIFDAITIVMSTNTPRILSRGTFPAFGSTITLAQGASISFGNMIIADNNTNADILGSNPLPFGTTITFAIDGKGVSVKGLATDTIVNTTSPTGPYGTTIAADVVKPEADLPSGVLLHLNIKVPNFAMAQVAWPVLITR